MRRVKLPLSKCHHDDTVFNVHLQSPLKMSSGSFDMRLGCGSCAESILLEAGIKEVDSEDVTSPLRLRTNEAELMPACGGPV